MNQVPVPQPENFPAGRPDCSRFGRPMLTVRVSKEFKSRLDARIEKLGMSQNQFCIEAIEAMLEFYDGEDFETVRTPAGT